MTADVMCDPIISPQLRGVQIDSSSLQLELPLNEAYSSGGLPNCPGLGGGKNMDILPSITFSKYGQDANLWADTPPMGGNHHLTISQFAQWTGDHAVGCTGATQFGIVTDPSNLLDYKRDDAGNVCGWTVGTASQSEGTGVTNGDHGWQCQDSYAMAEGGCDNITSPPGGYTITPVAGVPALTGGLWVEGHFWDFVSQAMTYGGPMAVDTWTPPVEIHAPGISGSLASGSTLTAVGGAFEGWDGPTGGITQSYTWQTCTSPTACSNVGTGNTYTLVADDHGHTIHLVDQASNTVGSVEAGFMSGTVG
jgi:hypothetical protein